MLRFLRSMLRIKFTNNTLKYSNKEEVKTMNQKIKLGDAVKRERDRRGMTQMQLADATGVSLRTITDVESYEANPRFDTLCQLIQYLRIPVHEIFYSDKEPRIVYQILCNELSQYSEDDLKIAREVLAGLEKGLHPDKFH